MNSISNLTLLDGRRFTAPCSFERGKRFSWGMYVAGSEAIGGLHVYTKPHAGFLTGTVRFSNAAIRPDGTGFCGAFYFETLSINSPRGYEWVTLPTFGQRVDGSTWLLIPRRADGKDHLARPRMTLEWTFALVPVGASREIRANAMKALKYEDVAIADPYPGLCGPTMTPLPNVDGAAYQAQYGLWANRLLDAQKWGIKCQIPSGDVQIAGIAQGPIGAHWFDGETSAGAPSGFGIEPTCMPFEQCPAGVLVHSIMHRANVARSFCAAYDRDTGKQIALEDWTTSPQWQVMAGEPGQAGRIELAPFLIGQWGTYKYRRFNSGSCPEEAALIQIESHDPAHSVRLFRHAIRVAQFVNDAAAIDDIVMQAEYNRAAFWNNRADEPTPKRKPSAGYWQRSLAKSLEEVTTRPHQGGDIDRIWSWSAFGGAAVLQYASDVIKEASWVNWGRDMLEFARLAADKFGIRGRYFHSAYMPANVSGIQVFHEMLVMVHALALGRFVLTAPELKAVAATNRIGLKNILTTLAPRKYYGSQGPPHWIGTAVNNVELAALGESTSYGTGDPNAEGDPAHVWAACAQTYLVDPSAGTAVLEYALPHWVAAANLDQRLAQTLARFPDKSWSGDMEVALTQALAARGQRA